MFACCFSLMCQTDRASSVNAAISCLWQPTSQGIMDGFSASCEIGPALILASRWGALLRRPAARLSLHPPLPSEISLPPSLALLCLSPSLSCVLLTDTNTAVCVSLPLDAAYWMRLPRGLQMGFTNTYQADFLSLAEWRIILLTPKIVLQRVYSKSVVPVSSMCLSFGGIQFVSSSITNTKLFIKLPCLALKVSSSKLPKCHDFEICSWDFPSSSTAELRGLCSVENSRHIFYTVPVIHSNNCRIIKKKKKNERPVFIFSTSSFIKFENVSV